MATTGAPRDRRAAHMRPTATAADVDTSDWPAEVAGTIESGVQRVRELTTGRAITAARWLVAAVLLTITGTAVLVLLVIAIVRILDAYLPDAVFGDDHIWAAYLIVGLLAFVPGLILLAKRTDSSPDGG